MTTHAHTVERVSIADVRARFRPKAWRSVGSVVLDHGGYTAMVVVGRAPAVGAARGDRRVFVCPRCGRHCNVLGVVPEMGWACRATKCGAWRSRTEPDRRNR